MTTSLVIDVPPIPQGEPCPQSGVGNQMTTMPTSQKRLLIALGIGSICFTIGTIADFLAPPLVNTLNADTLKWSFGLVSLTTVTVATFCARYFSQKNQKQVENTITPEIASMIKSCVEKELINATPSMSSLQTEMNHF
ncbi:MAG: hypothetical protein LBC45_05050 [Chlamydiales bacterium]|nr:hypothetical protein [Chlamydiales bacterium]